MVCCKAERKVETARCYVQCTAHGMVWCGRGCLICIYVYDMYDLYCKAKRKVETARCGIVFTEKRCHYKVKQV